MKNILKKNKILFLLSLFFYLQSVTGQNRSSRWIDMFSYHYISGIEILPDALAASSENAFFIYNKQDGTFQKYSTIEGLSGYRIVSMFYHQETGRYFIAHENGKIEIILSDGNVFRENSLFISGLDDESKKVEDVTSGGNLLFLAMPFGIATYNMDRLEFGDTYYIGNGGMELKVNDLTIFDNKLFAATQGEGIKYIDLDNPHKNDFTQWQQIDNGNWEKLTTYRNNLFAIRGNKLYRVDLPGTTQVFNASSHIIDCQANDTHLFVGLNGKIQKLNASFIVEEEFFSTATYPFSLNTFRVDNQNLYIGTKRFGLLQSPVPGNGNYTSIKPNSPLRNNPFAADIYNGQIWVVYGDYDQLYNPYPLDARGISHYINGRWKNIPYAAFNAKSLTDVKILPSDTSRVFIGSFHDGLLEFQSEQLLQKFDNTNSPIQPIVLGNPPQTYYDFRISPLIFDQDENLWMFQGLVMNGIHQYDLHGNWQSFSFSSIMNSPVNEGAAQMDFDRDGNLWIATHRLGLVGLNPQTGEMLALTEQNNIPYEGSYRNTQAVAIDKDNILWVGTLAGLRILRNPARAFTDPSVQLEKIIVELEELEGQNNQGAELLANTEITEIVVDGANNKWIGTSNAGVFYFSEDGQKTIYHFTEDNSPLPNNSIFDIAIDPVTGIVLFSTPGGLIGFKGDASEGKNNLNEAYIYPNPLNMKRHGQLIIRNLMSDINVKITDIEGNLVHETQSKGGTVTWDLKNFAGQKVASGVYLIFLTDREGKNTRILKALIIK